MNKCDICSENRYEVIWHVNGYDLMRCPTCGLVYANVNERDISNTYETDYYKSVYPDYESDRNIHEKNNIKLLQEIEKHFLPSTMIEIGSAFGFFLDIAGKRGWKASGYEISEYASMIAREKFHQNVRNENFLVADIQDSVDVICMFDTIEHLLRPSHYIEKISHTLRNGGGLIITTGDLSSWMARILGKRWRMIMPPFHVFYFSRKTITRLIKNYGFDILSISHESKYQNLNSIFKYQFGISKDVIPRIPIKVKLGDIIQIIAKKVSSR